MSTSEKPDHWKSLADVLGARPSEAEPSQPIATTPVADTPTPAAAAATPAAATPAPPVRPPETPRAKPTKPSPEKKPRADWRSLASLLGLGGSQAPVEPSAAEVPAATQLAGNELAAGNQLAAARDSASPAADDISAILTELQTRTPEITPSTRATATSRWNVPGETLDEEEIVDPLEMPAMAFVDEVADAVELDVVDAEAVYGDAAEGEAADGDSDSARSDADDSVGEERRRRRRRRRRRGRRPEPTATEGESRSADETGARDQAIVGEFAEQADEPGLPEEDSVSNRSSDLPTDRIAADTGDAKAEVSESEREPESDEGRPRRRRRRRRRGRSDESTPARNKIDQPHPPADDATDDDDVLAEVLAGNDEAGDGNAGDEEVGDDGQEGELHPSHKKIPSWQEAIEVVVASNLSQRTKHPNQGFRGRGRRDR